MIHFFLVWFLAVVQLLDVGLFRLSSILRCPALFAFLHVAVDVPFEDLLERHGCALIVVSSRGLVVLVSVD